MFGNTFTPFKIAVYLFLFGLLTLVSAISTQPQKLFPQQEVLGATTNLSLSIQPEAGREVLLDTVSGAQKEIFLEIYLLSDPQTISALKAARSRGVTVKVILEKNPFGGGNLNKVTFEKLRESGIETVWDNPSFNYTHAKMVIIDGEVVCVLNQNLTQTAFTKNREFNVCNQNSEDVAHARNIFQADFSRQSLSASKSNLVVSPDNSRGKLRALIEGATNSLDLEMEILEDPQMIELLISRSSSVPTRILIPDTDKVDTNRDAAQKLRSSGVQVRELITPYLHAKLILADKSRAYVGSVNLSTNSLENNREVGLILSQEDIIDKLSQTFEEDWKNGLEVN